MTYAWIDPLGRSRSPPCADYLDLSSAREYLVHNKQKAKIRAKKGESLGLFIRGGQDVGLGIFVTKVVPNSPADRGGLQAGDQILKVDKKSFVGISHSQAVAVFKASRNLNLVVDRLGKIPTLCAEEPNIKSSVSDPGKPSSAPVTKFGTLTSTVSGAQNWNELTSQAKAILSDDEYGNLTYYMALYLNKYINIKNFVENLMKIFDNENDKLSLFNLIKPFIEEKDKDKFEAMILRKQLYIVQQEEKLRKSLEHLPATTIYGTKSRDSTPTSDRRNSRAQLHSAATNTRQSIDPPKPISRERQAARMGDSKMQLERSPMPNLIGRENFKLTPNVTTLAQQFSNQVSNNRGDVDETVRRLTDEEIDNISTSSNDSLPPPPPPNFFPQNGPEEKYSLKLPYSTSSLLSRPSLSRVLSSFSPERRDSYGVESRLHLRADSQAESGIESEMSADPNGRQQHSAYALMQRIPKAKLSDRHRCSSCGAEQQCSPEEKSQISSAPKQFDSGAKEPQMLTYEIQHHQKYTGVPIPVLPVKKAETDRPVSVATVDENHKSKGSALRKPKAKRSLSKGSRIATGKSPSSSLSRKSGNRRIYHSEEDLQKGMNVSFSPNPTSIQDPSESCEETQYATMERSSKFSSVRSKAKSLSDLNGWETDTDSCYYDPRVEPQRNISSTFDELWARSKKVWIPKIRPHLGLRVAGGKGTRQTLPIIVKIEPYGCAVEASGLKLGSLVLGVDTQSLVGLNHQDVVWRIAKAFRNQHSKLLTLTVVNPQSDD